VAFTPKGAKSRRTIVLELLDDKNPEDILTYVDLADALSLSEPQHRGIIQASVNAAAKDFLKSHSHALEAVPNIGYRVVTADEHVRLAKGHQKRASKELVKGKNKADFVDFNELSPENRSVVEAVRTLFAAQIDFNRRTDIRQGNMERAVASIQAKQGLTEEEIANLNRRLAALESDAPTEK